ncbi:MAG: FAD-binding oxidoreductase [Hyphomicrobiaceae bacterium]
MATIAHKDLFHFDHPVKSYWEATAAPLGIETPPLKGETVTDVAIIGAGFTGLSAALRFRDDYDLDVTVLDAADPGWGASGRNGGFVGLGSAKLSYGELIKRYGLEDTKRFFEIQKEAVALVGEVTKRHGIACDHNPMGEMAVAHRPGRFEELKEDQVFLRDVIGKKTELLDVPAMKERGCYSPAFHGAIWGEVGASVHPLNYTRGLARAAAGNRVHIHGRSRVVRWEELADGHRLTTSSGAVLKARHVVVATNGFTQEEVSRRHAGRLMPALSSILVTRPLTEDERRAQGWTSLQMAYDTRKLLHYFRLLPDGRFLFGGRGGTDGSDKAAGPLERRLRHNFETLFPGWAHAEHTHFWRGYVCLTHDLVPYIGPLDEKRSVWTAIAYHGSGVAMASWSGRAVADLVAGRPERARLPSVLGRRLKTFPLPALRPAYLKGAYIWYDIKDNRD